MSELPKWAYSTIPNKASLRGTAIKQDSYWVTGSNNSIFVSQDAGNTWQDKSISIALKRDFRDIELFDNHTAIIMGAGTGALSTLYKTTDGGNHWQLLYQNRDKLGFFNAIAFWNQQQGLLIGDPVDGYYVIKKTTDGGKTFRRIAKKNIPSLQSKEAAFAASGNSIIVGNNGKAWIATGGFSASVYESNDYGETWQRNSVPLYQDTQTSGGYGVALNHLEQPFVIGGDYLQRQSEYANMARLSNGQWQSVKTGSIGLRTAMSCQAWICLTTGKTATDISYDAGNTWQALVSNQPSKTGKFDQGFYSLASDDSVFLAAGAEGKVGVLSFIAVKTR
ncbi:oxidoreductase [Colwellia sp. 12G3]|nr:oxidoreductase [Colwellia sp. 12G3]